MTELVKVVIVAAVFGIIAGLELVKIIKLRWDKEALSARLALRTEERDEAIKALEFKIVPVKGNVEVSADTDSTIAKRLAKNALFEELDPLILYYEHIAMAPEGPKNIVEAMIRVAMKTNDGWLQRESEGKE